MQLDSHITAGLPVLLTPQEVAKALRISMPGVYRLVEKRMIPFHRVRRSLRFTEQDIVAFLASSRVESVRRCNVYERT